MDDSTNDAGNGNGNENGSHTFEQIVELHTQNIAGLMENQLALTAQVQVLQAALATVLLNHPDRAALLGTFQKYMKICKDSAPRLAGRMEALEGGMLALLGQHQA